MPFILSLLARYPGSRDSHNDWIKFRGAGHTDLRRRTKNPGVFGGRGFVIVLAIEEADAVWRLETRDQKPDRGLWRSAWAGRRLAPAANVEWRMQKSE